MRKPFRIALALALVAPALVTNAQMITGVWKGKINRQKVELKIVQNGDSLTGTSYYYESASNFRRYSIRGYFDAGTNEAVWWDDQLIDEKSGRFSVSTPGRIPMLSRADFNCPGGGKMMLDGKAGKVYEDEPTGELHLDKITNGSFADEWDYVIDNFLTGANDPDIIDSIAHLSALRPVDIAARATREDPVSRPTPVVPAAAAPEKKPAVVPTDPPKAQTIEEKFTSRKKVLATEIPVIGDSIELRFYDYGEIDGDSISLFLNDKLIFSHIRLAGSAYIIHLSANDLHPVNELIMVAENLGSIPPNTSYMVALVGDKRYEARLESTEGSSAMVKLTRKVQTP